MDSYPQYDAADPREELLYFLRERGIPFLEEGDGVRFSLCQGAFQWETVCRFAPRAVLIYGVYPFLAFDRAGALEAANAANSQLQQGSLFLSGERPVVRVGAMFTDLYAAQETIASALAYSASAVCHFWEKMRACADSN